MWGLEYLMYFGVPSNKIELLEGHSRWAFPFITREHAELHFEEWLQTLARWKGTSVPPVQRQDPKWKADVNGISVQLFPRPIEVHFPMVCEAFHESLTTFWRPELWPAEGQGRDVGWKAMLDHQDVSMRLWSLFGDLCKAHGGKH